VDGDARLRVDFVRDRGSRLSVAADSVLGREERNELQVFALRDQVDVQAPLRSMPE
jgi:hypothetical protein